MIIQKKTHTDVKQTAEAPDSLTVKSFGGIYQTSIRTQNRAGASAFC